jgi:hypothetical protein
MAKFNGTPGPGRHPGVPNKVTQANREAFQLLVDANLGQLQEWILRVADEDPARAFDMVMSLASHCIPKLKSIEISGEVQQTIVRFVDARTSN